MKIREIMSRDVLTATPDTPVFALAQRMRDGQVCGIPVVDAARHVVGIVTELDLILRNTHLEPPGILAFLDGRFPLESPRHYRERLRHVLGTRASDVMRPDVVTIGPEAELEDLADLMVHRHVNPIPVVEDGVLVGIVSRHDIVAMMARDVELHGAA